MGERAYSKRRTDLLISIKVSRAPRLAKPISFTRSRTGGSCEIRGHGLFLKVARRDPCTHGTAP